MNITRRRSTEVVLVHRKVDQVLLSHQEKATRLASSKLKRLNSKPPNVSHLSGCPRLTCCHQRKSWHCRVISNFTNILCKPSGFKCPGLGMISYPCQLVSQPAEEKKENSIGLLLSPSSLHVSNPNPTPLRCEWLSS